MVSNSKKICKNRTKRTPICLPSDSPVIYILLHLLYLLLFIGGRTVPLPPQNGVVEVCELTDNSHISGGKTIIYMLCGTTHNSLYSSLKRGKVWEWLRTLVESTKDSTGFFIEPPSWLENSPGRNYSS